MASGVPVNDDCVNTFNQKLKLKPRGEPQLKYITFKLSDDRTQIVVDKASTSTDYDRFLEDLPESECRWAAYDFEYELGEGKRNKIVFISWAPDTARIKDKMVYASSKAALSRTLIGIGAEVQGSDFSEVAEDVVLEKLKRR